MVVKATEIDINEYNEFKKLLFFKNDLSIEDRYTYIITKSYNRIVNHIRYNLTKEMGEKTESDIINFADYIMNNKNFVNIFNNTFGFFEENKNYILLDSDAFINFKSTNNGNLVKEEVTSQETVCSFSALSSTFANNQYYLDSIIPKQSILIKAFNDDNIKNMAFDNMNENTDISIFSYPMDNSLYFSDFKFKIIIPGEENINNLFGNMPDFNSYVNKDNLTDRLKDN